MLIRPENHDWEIVWLTHEITEQRCKKCGAPYEKRTQDCCLRPLTEEELRKIENDALDFRLGRWINYAKVF